MRVGYRSDSPAAQAGYAAISEKAALQITASKDRRGVFMFVTSGRVEINWFVL